MNWFGKEREKTPTEDPRWRKIKWDEEIEGWAKPTEPTPAKDEATGWSVYFRLPDKSELISVQRAVGETEYNSVDEFEITIRTQEGLWQVITIPTYTETGHWIDKLGFYTDERALEREVGFDQMLNQPQIQEL